MKNPKMVKVCVLHKKHITPEVVDDINRLLRRQHSHSLLVDESFLHDYTTRSSTVLVTAKRGKKTVGLGTLICVEPLGHWYGTIHNLIIETDEDITAVGKLIVETLISNRIGHLEYIEGGAWVQDTCLLQIFNDLDFKDRPKSRFRLKLP